MISHGIFAFLSALHSSNRFPCPSGLNPHTGSWRRGIFDERVSMAMEFFVFVQETVEGTKLKYVTIICVFSR